MALLVSGAGAHIIEHVHEVDVAVVGAFVGGEIFVYVAVGPVFGAHVIEMVGGGELAPIGQQNRVGFLLDDALQLIELVQRVGLHGVAEPRRQIALGVGPGNHVGDVDVANRI